MPSTSNASKPSQRGACFVWGLIFLLVLVFLTIAGLFLGRMYLRNQVKQSMTPTEYAEMRRFLDTPADFPMEWAVVEPYPEDLLASIRELLPILEHWNSIEKEERPQVKEHGRPLLEKLQRGQPLTLEEADEVSALLEEARPLLDGLRNLARHPDYEMGAVVFICETESAIDPTYTLHACFRILETQARYTLSLGDSVKAGEEGLVMLQLLRRHRASSGLIHISAVRLVEKGHFIIASAMSACEEGEEVRAALEELRSLSPVINLNALERQFLTEIVGELRSGKRKREHVDLEPGEPGEVYLRQYFRLIHKKVIGAPPSLKERIVYSFTPAEWVYELTVLDFSESISREKSALAVSDLTRIHLAKRIRRDESGPETTDVRTLVPSLLPKEPLDPFTGASYLFDPSAEEFYSIGPDEVDDQRSLRYSPTNGAVSAGDIFVR